MIKLYIIFYGNCIDMLYCFVFGKYIRLNVKPDAIFLVQGLKPELVIKIPVLWEKIKKIIRLIML